MSTSPILLFQKRGFRVFLGHNGYMIMSPHGHKRDLYFGKPFHGNDLMYMYNNLVMDPKSFVQNCSKSPNIDTALWAEFVPSKEG